ncbi:hypothetical protein E3E12_07215 [Formicincola oecophyllae]|uniref:Rap1a immunity protein domain-containing protein n=1 Tax=Formicincola oecophyllae TaxID=2558361 RepID=A0A4Y6UC83_9PROT|nr:Rap1a/Tai family immunity protein [Formicincola oecophyllae]QDH14001.1 hypothetical protein E3E12_07215 [Formicincola oecophyllae]
MMDRDINTHDMTARDMNAPSRFSTPSWKGAKRAFKALLGGCALAAAVGLAGAQPAHAQRISHLTGQMLQKICTNQHEVAMCDAYISGVMDGEVWARDFATFEHAPAPVAFCVPVSQNIRTVRNVFLAWISAHPDGNEQQAGKVVYRALHDNFPCSGSASGMPGGAK